MDEIVKDFLIESNENLDRLDQELVRLETDPTSKDLLASIFRTIHTIKGSCGFLGFANLEAVAHAGESLLSKLRDGKLVLDADLTSALLEMVDAVRRMLREIQSTETDGENKYPKLLEKLKRLLGGASALPVPVATSELLAPQPATPSVGAPSTEQETPPAKKAEVAAEPATANLKYGPSRGKIGGILVERGRLRPESLALALQEQERGDRRRLGEILTALGLCRPEDIAAAQQILEARGQDSTVETVRVAITLLDRLMNLVGELVLARNQLLQYAHAGQDGGFQALSQRMNLIATELQEEVMKTRMQPIGNVWNKFPRTVRDLAKSCNKEVRLEMEGKDTELDKTIIEAIKDPLTHLVRNSIDHGIESPEIRRRAGKDPTGVLKLRAFHEGGEVNIEISDDGAGLDVEKIRKKAIERGVISAEQASRLQERDVFKLIFLPGLSTAEKVTNVSGRGVGMDVVRTNIEKIGGTVDVQSTFGRGATVKVKIPLTLAIIPALIVTSGSNRFAIPQVALMELVSLNAKEGVEMVHGAPVCRLRGNLLPLVHLHRELKLAEPPPSDVLNVVVLRADERLFGLMVDSIHDTQEIVVKPLRKQLNTTKMFAGASIMGDGRVALILDVVGLAQRAGIIAELKDKLTGETAKEQQESAHSKQMFLLFAGPGGSRMAVPLDAVSRLEELPTSQVELNGNQWVAQYRGKIMPLVSLDWAMKERRARRRDTTLPALSSADSLQMLVCNQGSQAVGVVVERILDIVEDSMTVRYPASRPGVLYSTVISGSVTELIDIPAILVSAGVEVENAPVAEKVMEKAAN